MDYKYKQKFPNIKCLRKTQHAILVENDAGLVAWIPQKLVDDDSEVWGTKFDRCEGTLVVEAAFAEKIVWKKQ